MNALAPLHHTTYLAVLELVRANELDESHLACHMTRQQGHGRKAGDPASGSFFDVAGFSISYNLMLCEFCGNLEPRAHCPAKMRELAAKWLNA